MRQVIDPWCRPKKPVRPSGCGAPACPRAKRPIRWPCCSSKRSSRLKRWPTLKIFATDVEQLNIETAGAGTYPESIGRGIAPATGTVFRQEKGNSFVVKNELRQCIVFARHNLLTDPPFTKMDLVVCRNALIYFRSRPRKTAHCVACSTPWLPRCPPVSGVERVAG
jgi:two-component system CheB/CheR fusion protein